MVKALYLSRDAADSLPSSSFTTEITNLMAIMAGRLETMDGILRASPESITQVNYASETPLDVPLPHDQMDAKIPVTTPYSQAMFVNVFRQSFANSPILSMPSDSHCSKPTIEGNSMNGIGVIELDISNVPAPGILGAFGDYLFEKLGQSVVLEILPSSSCKSPTWPSTKEKKSTMKWNYAFMLASVFILTTLNPPSGGFVDEIIQGTVYSKVKPPGINLVVSVAWIILIISLIHELLRVPYLFPSLAALFGILVIGSPEAIPILKPGGLVLLVAGFMQLASSRIPLSSWKRICIRGSGCSNINNESVSFKKVSATGSDV